MKDFFAEKRPHNGLTYKAFSEKIKNEVENANNENMDEKEKSLYEYTKMNIHRSNRIHKTYKPGEEIASLIKQINSKQIWMVITEGWCGDSAQNLPYIAMMSELNENIDFRIILRDENLDIMDHYLINGKSRSIPKLVVFDEDGEELFQWGPRPKEAQELVDKVKADGLSKDELNQKLHLWYGRNRGKNIESDFIDLLRKHLDVKKEAKGVN